MAIKERLLKQLQNIRDGLRAMPPFHSRDLTAMRNALVQARDLCFQGLSEKHFANYQDTYDGLLLAVDQLAAGAPDAGEIVSLCSELLQYMMTQTQKENAFKKEIFFLPYKASMWDSLESVWKAADEDKEHCIAYVMPIPYADLTPEHTAAEWHCERELFPKDVPTVDWEKFDLQEIRPDVIFIHNPYDAYNRVTSVESRYFSSKLKNQTDKLVYIPYFVLTEPEIDGKSKEEIEKIEESYEHFITVPAVLNANQVIVQSETMRQVYIDVLTRRTDRTDRAFWEKRISGTGSPKFDKVVSTKKEDLDIPDEWLKIIEKPDGSRKKIVFYNTGLSALLHNDEKMLTKMRQVFRTFQEHHDEIALLWRPHPLIPATIKSMRPQLEKAYEKIVQQYKKAGWGIYDDSGDLDRAIVLSDAYYGDWSSVVQLYQQTGKPILIQDINLNTLDTDATLDDSRRSFIRKFGKSSCFMDAAFHDGYMYFSENRFNGLFRVKDGGHEAEFLQRFPNEDIWQTDLHRNVFLKGDKLFFIPHNGHGISVYDIAQGDFSFINITKESKMLHYAQCILNDNDILLIPAHRNTPFARLHLDTESVDILQDITDKVNTLIPQSQDKFIFSAYSAIKNREILWLAVLDTNMLLRLSMEPLQVETVVIPVNIHLRFLNQIGNYFYCTLREHKVLIWSMATMSYRLHKIPGKILDRDYPYLQVIPCNESVLILSGREDHFWRFDPISAMWTDLASLFPSTFQRDIAGSLLFLGYTISKNGELILYPRAGNGVLKYDFEQGIFIHQKISRSDKAIDELHKIWNLYFICKGDVMNESNLYLSSFLELKTNLSDVSTVSIGKLYVGTQIYSKLG